MPESAHRRAVRLGAAFFLGLAGVAALPAQEYSFRYLGTAEGLENMAVLNLYQDRTGFLWLTTEDGIYRFDGKEFAGYGPGQGIPSNEGTAFGEGPDGALLAGGQYGLYRLARNRFEKIPGWFHGVGSLDGIASDGRGGTWVGTENGLVELVEAPGGAGYEERRIAEPAGVTGRGAWGVFAEGSTIWWGCGEQLCRRDQKGTVVYGARDGLADAEWDAILKDRQGNLWVRGGNAGEYVLKRGEEKFERLEKASQLDAFVYGAALAADGRVLLPAANGLYLQDGAGWKQVDQSAGLMGTAYTVLEDRQHRLWIGMASRGLAEWEGYGEWEKYSAASGLTNDVVFGVLPAGDGSMWAGTSGGLFHGVKEDGRLRWKHLDALGNSEVMSVLPLGGGELLVGMARHGVARVDVRRNRVAWYGKLDGLHNKMVHVIRFDGGRRLWVVTGAGVYVADAPYTRYRQIGDFGSGRFWALAVARNGVVWAGGDDGLFAYDGSSIRHWNRENGLSSDEVTAIATGPDGAVWAGHWIGGGIDRLVKTATGRRVERNVQRAGSEALIDFLGIDAHGRLWAGTGRGVDMWNGARWTHYGTEDGLAWNDCNLNGFAETGDGAIWISTGGGLSRFKPQPQRWAQSQAAVVFTSLMVGRKDVTSLNEPSFAMKNNSLTAQFAVPNAARQDSLVFRYRLGGDDAAWTETSRHELQFAGLAPGSYRLEVEAQDASGGWSIDRATFGFTIRPPLYLSWWAILLYLTIPGAGVLLVMRLRGMAARKRERELRQLVELRTNDLKAANAELLRLSHTDALTGLANRRVFDEALLRECARLQRSGTYLSLVILDVDLFKALNDSAGHQWGDTCLAKLAAELGKVARRPTDLAARIGGEEFALLLPDTDPAGALDIAEAARQAAMGLRLKHPNSPVGPWLTFSAGVATAMAGVLDTERALVAAADFALYEAKRAGRNLVMAAGSESRTRFERSVQRPTV